jgi:hypothetical protein
MNGTKKPAVEADAAEKEIKGSVGWACVAYLSLF